jgi:integration host factor subunit beta
MATVTKRELIERIAAESGQRRSAVKETIQQFLDAVIDELGKGNRLEFRDFGVFEVKLRAARRAQNPKTLERVDVPSKQTVKFKPGRRMRELLDIDSDYSADDIADGHDDDRDAASASPQKGSNTRENPPSTTIVEHKPEAKSRAASNTQHND